MQSNDPRLRSQERGKTHGRKGEEVSMLQIRVWDKNGVNAGQGGNREGKVEGRKPSGLLIK